MAWSGNNQLYPNGKKNLLLKKIDVEDVVANDNLLAALVSTSYSPAFSDEFFNTSVVANRIGSSVALAASSIAVNTTTGVVTFDASDVTFSSVTAGSTVGKIIIYVNGATPGTDDYLLTYFDNDGSSISLATNGADITVSFNASGIFAL
tara:strand:+ start:529 stop:975 length:447 start_codon:yes stop_codon:yes gene_type:complete